nr:collagen alpha-1(IV) chain-like [Salvelinus alpinus]
MNDVEGLPSAGGVFLVYQGLMAVTGPEGTLVSLESMVWTGLMGERQGDVSRAGVTGLPACSCTGKSRCNCDGVKGSKGDKGDSRSTGPPGDLIQIIGRIKGFPGLPGPLRPPGYTGDQGIQGEQGTPGSKGSQGPPGSYFAGPIADGFLFTRHSQNVPQCPGGSNLIYAGYSLLFINGNNRGHGQNLVCPLSRYTGELSASFLYHALLILQHGQHEPLSLLQRLLLPAVHR